MMLNTQRPEGIVTQYKSKFLDFIKANEVELYFNTCDKCKGAGHIPVDDIKEGFVKIHNSVIYEARQALNAKGYDIMKIDYSDPVEISYTWFEIIKL